MKRRHSAIQSFISPNFITTTVVRFCPIFKNESLAEILLGKMNLYSQQYGNPIHGFVIMPSHLHILLSPTEKATGSKFMERLKEYSSKGIIKWCIDNNKTDLLKIFSDAALEYKQEHKYQVWQKRFDDFVITKPEDLLIKLNYIHNNPLQERWKLCERVEDYRFSSARYYMSGEYTGINITKVA